MVSNGTTAQNYSDLKSTITHGSLQREEESEKGENSGYYAWPRVPHCRVLQRGPGLLTETMLTTAWFSNGAHFKQSPDGFNRF